MGPILWCIAAGGGTSLGAVMLTVWQRPSDRAYDLALGASAGIMLAATVLGLLPAALSAGNLAQVTVGFAVGVVLVVFDPEQTSREEILKLFWETHDPTQGMRQGNDMGTQYRSGIYVSTPEQRAAAEATRDQFAARLRDAGYGEITTEIVDSDPAHPFYYAEDYHQQYLHKVPNGYCGLGGTGVSCPIGLSAV